MWLYPLNSFVSQWALGPCTYLLQVIVSASWTVHAHSIWSIRNGRRFCGQFRPRRGLSKPRKDAVRRHWQDAPCLWWGQGWRASRRTLILQQLTYKSVHGDRLRNHPTTFPENPRHCKCRWNFTAVCAGSPRERWVGATESSVEDKLRKFSVHSVGGEDGIQERRVVAVGPGLSRW